LMKSTLGHQTRAYEGKVSVGKLAVYMTYADHTKSEAEMYRSQMLSTQKENDILRHNVIELQEQLQNSYKRIAELIDGNMER